jgi:hypothetical protein
MSCCGKHGGAGLARMGSDDPGRDQLVTDGRVYDALDSEAGVFVETTTGHPKLN